jgi:MFS family permease
MSKTTVSPTRSYPGGLTRHDVVAWRNATFTIFGLCGIGMASWIARVPAVRDSLGASTLQMGMLIFGLAAGSILGLLASGHVIARFGAARTIAWCLTLGPIGFAFAGVFATVGPSFAAVFIGLAVFGAAFSITDVSMNVSGAANERVSGRSIMPIFHACFSFGTMLGAGGGALAEWAGLPIAIHTAIIAAVMIGGTQVAVRFLQSEDLVADGVEVSTADGDRAKTWRGRLDMWRDSRTLLIGLIVLGMAFAEGSANDWLALALVDGHAARHWVGVAGFALFVTAMTTGRLVGPVALDRFGRVPVLLASAAAAFVGLLTVILSSDPLLAAVGIVIWGLGAALGFPVGMSAAADDPRRAARRVSVVATIGYGAFLAGPPLLGFVGNEVGTLDSLYVVAAAMVPAAVLVLAVRRPVVPYGEQR